MKIVMPCHFPLEGSGSGDYSRSVASELVRAGHEVLVICPGHRPDEGRAFETDTILFAADQPVEGVHPEVHFNFPCFTSHPASTATFYDLSAPLIGTYIGALQYHVAEAVRSWKPDVLHAGHAWLTAYVCNQTDAPYVVTVHGSELEGYARDERYREHAREGARGARALIAHTAEMAERAAALYDLPRERITVIDTGDDWAAHAQALLEVYAGG